MNNLLYTYPEVCDLIRERDLNQFEREDSEDKFLWQFAKNGSSLHVKTIMQSRYVLYATEKDYNFLKRKADTACRGIVLKESKKEDLEFMISQYEEVSSKAILFVKHADRILQQDCEEKKLPHMILFFTNDNLEFVLDCLSEAALAKAKPVEKKVVTYVKPVKPVEPDYTDEEIKSVLPEGCHVAHLKYGEGVIQDVVEGKIKVLFEDSVEKVFAAKVCINKKLLQVI